MVVTVAGSGHGHVFLSRDGGRSWRDIDGGGLPDVPHHAVELVGAGNGEIVVAGDAGVFATADEGATWVCWNGDLPHVMVTDVVHHVAGQRLLVATYGRGIWALPAVPSAIP